MDINSTDLPCAADLEKYITHKNIFDYLNDNKEIKTMKLYTSFAGNIIVRGSNKRNSQSFALLEPCEVLLERKGEGILIDNFGDIGNLFAELNYGHFNSKQRKEETDDKWSLYPKDTITDFERSIKVTKDNKELPSNYLEKLKFFPRMDMAEVNFIKMVDYYLDKSGLNNALETYKILNDKLGEEYPEYFFI